ncbi:acyltransferase [Jidongwangia harbinensis]|uniref:acyltransferase n=1 Tax=Jidongwangia harbinensis TaxID=2878561 RepID=UPI001CDA33D6|nr:acyltransferase [Jidongwangia harbinensis]MCA2213269.1 acyltransferase [Jidongwangia harbinensis]
MDAVRFARRLRARCGFGNSISYGSDFVVGPSFRLARGRTVKIGDKVSIGRNFDCMTNAVIGDNIMISSSVAFIGNDHSFNDPTKEIQSQGPLPIPTVRLDGNNLIGYGSIILGDVTIGRGAIIGAGSLVTNDMPEDMICVGRPARPVKSRYEED